MGSFILQKLSSSVWVEEVKITNKAEEKAE